MDFPGEKLVIKLWETLAEKGVGSLLTPWQTGREGRARIEIRRQELLMLAQAKVDAAEIGAGRIRFEKDGTLRRIEFNNENAGHENIQGRIEPKLDFSSLATSSLSQSAVDGARAEINVSKAIIYAEEQLAADQQLPPERPIEEDWLFIWRDHAGKISNEDLQRLWGSILAGEVKSPGKYSLRTLEFLKGLSKSEAEQIAKLARFVVESHIIRSQKEYLAEQGVSFEILLKMQELGVISGVEGDGLVSVRRSFLPEKFVRIFRSNGKALVAKHDDPTKTLELEIYPLTSIGAQILELGSFEPDLAYLRLVGSEIAAQGYKVFLADWVQISERKGQYLNAEELKAPATGTA